MLEEPTYRARTRVRSIRGANEIKNTNPLRAMLRLKPLLPQVSEGWEGIEISGCPEKWLTGQNVWGSGDYWGRVREYIYSVCDRAGIMLTPEERYKIEVGDYVLRRLDVTTNLRLASQEEVARFLAAMQVQSEGRHSNVTARGTTVYVGKSSKIKELKFYDKQAEIIAHKRQYIDRLGRDGYDDIVSEAAGLVRVELRLNSQFFNRRGILTGQQMTQIDMAELLQAEVQKMMDAGQYDISDNRLDELEGVLRRHLEGNKARNSVMRTWRAWREGRKVRQEVSKDTYYKHRKIILNVTGIDIKNIREQAKDKRSNVVPLITYIEASWGEPSPEYERKYLTPAA